MPVALLIIAQINYQDHELDGTRRGLIAAGFSVVLASSEARTCTGKFGGKEEATVALRDVNMNEYDRIAFIGGPGAESFVNDTYALQVAREAAASGKPLGAICIAPLILAVAGVLHGKRATVWDDGQRTQIEALQGAGALYTDAPVVQDGLLVTGNGPAAAEEFGRLLAQITSEMPL